MKTKTILGATIGNCVHVAGVANFLRIASDAGFDTELLGIAVPVDKIINAVKEKKPDVLALSYRLTPDNGKILLNELLDKLETFPNLKLLFGGLPELAEYAEKTNRFIMCFKGDEIYNKIDYAITLLKGKTAKIPKMFEKHYRSVSISQKMENLPSASKGSFYPLLRHHFGLPSLEDTIKGVKKIAEAEVLDIISLAPDQNAQEYFFYPEKMDPKLDGTGGVPLRKASDLRKIFMASQTGNYPKIRIYSGTRDLLKWAKLSVKELKNAWGAVPIFWFSELDGRSKRPLLGAIKENQAVIRWYGQHNIPVEVLEPHQWSLRDAPDSVAIAMAFIGAYNAKTLGVKHFIAQYMFNTPRYTAPFYDLGKMLAKLSLIETLRDDNFIPYRQVRAGLSHFSIDQEIARGQLITSSVNMLGLRPHILHVVGFSEGNHAAHPDDVIAACKMIHGMLKNTSLGLPDPLHDKRIFLIKEKLLKDASWVLGTIYALGKFLHSKNPLSDPEILLKAVELGILDAPHLRGQPHALGIVETRPFEGGCKAIDQINREVLTEQDRLKIIFERGPAKDILGKSAKKLITQLDLPKNEIYCPQVLENNTIMNNI